MTSSANRSVWVIGALIAFGILAQIILLQTYRITQLQTALDIASRAKDVETDQSAELMYRLTQLQNQLEHDGIKQYVAGITRALEKPDHYDAIWHAGYDRGAKVQQDADALDVQKMHTTTTKETK